MMDGHNVDELLPIFCVGDWVASATKINSGDEYLKSAIDIALLVTQELCRLVASAEL